MFTVCFNFYSADTYLDLFFSDESCLQNIVYSSAVEYSRDKVRGGLLNVRNMAEMTGCVVFMGLGLILLGIL